MSHADGRSAAFASLFSDLPLAEAYRLSDEESKRRGMHTKATAELDLTYGDVGFDCIARIIEAVSPRPGSCFVDLGSGVGRGVLAAAVLFPFATCVGVELLSDLHEAAQEPARRFGQLRARLESGEAVAQDGLHAERMAGSIELRNGDLFEHSLAGASAEGILVFVCCVTWSTPIMQRLAQKLGDELNAIEQVVVRTQGRRA